MILFQRRFFARSGGIPIKNLGNLWVCWPVWWSKIVFCFTLRTILFKYFKIILYKNKNYIIFILLSLLLWTIWFLFCMKFSIICNNRLTIDWFASRVRRCVSFANAAIFLWSSLTCFSTVYIRPPKPFLFFSKSQN